MGYIHVTKGERILIHRWKQEGCTKREIARRLGRSHSTILRELRRNTGKKGYRPKQAQAKAEQRAQRKGERKLTEDLKTEIRNGLHKGWTPEAISNRARTESRPYVCKETIYKYIYADAKEGGDLWLHLPRAKKKRKRRCPREDRRGRIKNQRMISERPDEVKERKTNGHWEGDLINGAHGTGHLVTIAERRSRFTLVGRTDSKETQEVIACMTTLLNIIPAKNILSITLDNGKEFANHQSLSEDVGIDVFFANPYHSWERGTSENRNGIVRRLHPKGASFIDIGKAELQKLDTFLNDRPMKCLGWLTPREVLFNKGRMFRLGNRSKAGG